MLGRINKAAYKAKEHKTRRKGEEEDGEKGYRRTEKGRNEEKMRY